jgi:ATP-dependent Lon protease
MAAYRAGIRTLIIPEENRKDLEKIPDYVLEQFHVLPVQDVQEVLRTALIRK